MAKKEQKSSGLGKFIFGAAVGVGLGVLFAPKSGKETRKDLKTKLDELVEKVKNIKAEDVKEALHNKITEIKDGLEDLDKEKVLEIAKEKAGELKTKLDELVDMAKEKAEPVVQKAVDDVRVKTIQVLKDTVDKLEKEDKKKTTTKKKGTK